MKPSLIVHIASYYPPHLGGLERVAEEVAEELVQHGRRVLVLTSTTGSKKEKKIQPSNLSIKRLWAFEFAHTPIMPGLLWQLLRVPKRSLFHLHLAQAYVPEMVWIASKIRRIPYVVHYHLDVEPSGIFGFVFVWWKKWIQARILTDAAFVITLSPDQTHLVQERYGIKSENIMFIGNGVSQKFLEIGTRERIFHTPLRLLFVGRLVSQKRVERLIEAMVLLHAPATLTIVGDGEDRDRLEKLVQARGLTSVTFAGSLFGKDLQNAYAEADVFVLPSDREGMPLAALEAMGAGLPMVGSEVLGISELLFGVGILVKDPSPSNFAAALNKLLASPERLQVLHIASCMKAKEFSWEKSVAKLEEIYDNLYSRI